ncbi:MAG: hypothetical protein ACJASR_000127 [Psychroserpens sp.]|jgi:hypothetical protein
MKKTTEESFLNDVKDHKLTIISDEGNTRHIRLKAPDTGNQYYDLTTWGDHLCISGDMGTYVFQRNEDMFAFFRKSGDELRINPSYWHEKLQSDSQFGGAMEFSSEMFDEYVKEAMENFYDENFIFESDEKVGQLREEAKVRCLESLNDSLLCLESEHDAREAVEEAYWVDHEDENQVAFAESLKCDFWEVELQEFTDYFIWCLYAIVWGIKKYDSIPKAGEIYENKENKVTIEKVEGGRVYLVGYSSIDLNSFIEDWKLIKNV